MIKTSIFGQQAGLVSGSTQGSAAITSNGYKVSASVGHMTDSIQETANGYKVYSSIQGSTSADVSVTVPPM